MELQDAYAAIRAQGAQLLTISVDSVTDARRMADHANAQFPVLTDEDYAVTRAYGLFDLLGDGVSAPATLIIDRDGDFTGSYVGTGIADRVQASAILEFLESMSGAPAGTRG